MTVWMPTKKYWSDTFGDNVVICSDFQGRYTPLDLSGNDPVLLWLEQGVDLSGYKVNLEKVDGKYRISRDGKYLAVKDGKTILTEKCDCESQLWEIKRIAQNRFRIYSPFAKLYLHSGFYNSTSILMPYSNCENQSFLLF